MGRRRTNVVFAAVAIAAVLVSIAVLVAYLAAAPSGSVLRLGYFPNLTHSQAIYGISTGFFQSVLRPDVTLDARAFNAGPTAILALLANQVDMIFVGPSPTLSGLAAAGPDVLRVIAGGGSGGALFIIQPELTLNANADYTGKKFASPQAGNTQDIALKHFLFTKGHQTMDQGGDVDVINAPNPDILSLFRLHQIDGAWVPEPWATRLVLEEGGKVFLDERSLWPNGRFVSTHLLTTKTYLGDHHSLISRFLEAEVTLTLLLQNATLPVRNTINEGIKNVTGSLLPDDTMTAAFANVNVTYDPVRTSLTTYLTWGQELGFLPSGVDASQLYDLRLLNDILSRRGLPKVN